MLLLIGCVQAPVLDPPPIEFHPPDEVGPYGAGADTFTWTDDRGKEMVAEVWFPTEPGCSPDEYEELPMIGMACRGVDPSGDGWPLVAFSHGYGGIRYQSIFLTEWLATHGFVVVAPDHEHNTLLDLDDAYTTEVALERPGDVIRAVDQLAVARPGLAEADRYAMSGHSFGAWTTLAVAGGDADLAYLEAFCAESPEYDLCGLDLPPEAALEDGPDARVVAAMPMAPVGWYTYASLDAMPPTLLMGGERDQLEAEILPLYDRLPVPARLSVLADGGHYAYTDICELGAIAEQFAEDCGEVEAGYIEMDVAHEIVRAQATAFFAYAMRGDARYLDWLGAEWPEVDWEERL
ncbi:MAG: alpha/beta hydrolase family protein [Myxococcota bacterium]